MSQSCRMVSMVLYFYHITMIIYILYYLVFKILSSLVRDSSYDMYYKGCGLLCAHKKSFNTAIPVRSLGPYMYVHYCTCIVHILVWTYLFLLTSFFDCLSFCGLFLKHPYKRFFPFYILYFYLSRSLSLSHSRYLYLSTFRCLCLSICLYVPPSPSLSVFLYFSLSVLTYLPICPLSLSLSSCVTSSPGEMPLPYTPITNEIPLIRELANMEISKWQSSVL